MKKIISGIFAVAVLFSSCSRDTLETEDDLSTDLKVESTKDLLTIPQINAIIDRYLQTTGDFNWSDVSDQVLWSATVHGDHILTIGYGASGESFRTENNRRLETVKGDIIFDVMTSEGVSLKEALLEDDPILNVIDLEVKNIETISALRGRSNIRYLEPNGYSFYAPTNSNIQNRSSSGCDKSGEILNTNDYRTIAPNSLISWTYDQHNIEQAWSHSTGADVTVGLIDTGISPNQPFLGSNFNDGHSSGRTIQKYGTFIDSSWWWSSTTDGPNDKCGHGTSMASTIASPRNNNFMPVGVAYNCNLVSYRATEDVLLNDYHERKGVKNALVALGNRSDVKIISMSIGYPWSIGNVKDGIRYAYSRGKLIFAAGGTSLDFTNWYPVIFPASMSETIAVTGITDNGNYQQCDTCHDGSEIEFTIVMQRDSNNNRTGTTLGFYNGDTDYVGGSSVATATTAGIAALVWAKYPNWSRSQVLNRLRQSSEFYPNRDGNKGYGNINALEAVQ
ncbi:S8 family peptidase [Cochleicola gelatinilyticus]|uniref:Serine protease n=1 Tax=Cochleicola gelatinilyticus TaxID=1763537 RepID=A0A167F3S5_9FLAO|nr:S8/S53 family peptidase [Cochleicola gelatinilyticus]OAB76162.1 serine protease [Cochleicola gelatinilyticus]